MEGFSFWGGREGGREERGGDRRNIKAVIVFVLFSIVVKDGDRERERLSVFGRLNKQGRKTKEENGRRVGMGEKEAVNKG